MHFQGGLLVNYSGPVISNCPDSPDGRHRLGSSHEMALRARNRELANRMAVRGMWHEGTCVSCGLDDQVTGLPGSEYCRYCEEMRVLIAAAAETVLEHSPPQLPSPGVSSRRLTASFLLGLAGFLLVIADGPQLAGVILLTASLLLSIRS